MTDTTILDHINAGRYPRDDNGRPLVPMRNRRTAVIYAADAPGDYCIAGSDGESVETWRADGVYIDGGGNSLDLMPPKVPT